MKSLCLTISDGKSVCAVNSTIIITNKEGKLRLTFGGSDKENLNISYSWYSADLNAGDRYTIKYKDLDAKSLSPAEDIVDYGNSDEIRKRMLENYIRLKKELTEEGII
jgi:hypothetical protein